MALRFLADHCISNTIVRALRDAALEVVRLKEVLPVESPNTIVNAKAQEIDAILLSMNGDFADIVTYPPKNCKGIVALQMRNRAEVLDPLMERLAWY
jgi:predicted nuclease of predicted toxin-antitoxin system